MSSPNSEKDADAQSVLHEHCVSVYLNDTEHAKLQAAAKKKRRRMGALLRDAYLSGHVINVPEPNLEKWVELSRALSNANQLTMKVNSGDLPEDLRPLLARLVEQVHCLRADLLGQRDPKNGGLA